MVEVGLGPTQTYKIVELYGWKKLKRLSNLCKAVKTLETGSEELSGNCLRFHKGPLGKHYHCITSHPQTDPLTTTTICLLTILHWQWTYPGSASGLAWNLSCVCSHLVG